MELNFQKIYLESAIKQFRHYKNLGEKAVAQVEDEKLFFSHHEDSNSIAVIVRHLSGNMLSRWTEPFTTDGEKTWRERDTEFLNVHVTRQELMAIWEQGWTCLLDFLHSLKAEDFGKVLYIRNEEHTLTDAINRQLCHYAYHVGQIIYIAKLFSTDGWQTLSIPRNGSSEYNAGKFSQEKDSRHFTDGEK